MLRIEGGLFFANADSVRVRVREHAREARRAHRRARRRDHALRGRDARCACSTSSREDLEREHVRLLLARDVGQVRDVVRRAGGDPELTHVYPSVREAVEAAAARS